MLNVITVLLIILVVLMVMVGGKRGIQSFFILITNFLLFFMMILLMAFRVPPVIVTLITCGLISFCTLFFSNGYQKKSIAAFLSVFIVMLLVLLITYQMVIRANIQGFSNQQADMVSFYSTYIQLDFSKLVICEILVGLLGAVIDVAISISSAMNELHKNNPFLSAHQLFLCGMTIGRDVLGMMTNTMLFAFISGFMTLIVYFKRSHYSFVTILNSKLFVCEAFQTICSGIGIVFIIPLTAYMTAQLLTIPFQFTKDSIKHSLSLLHKKR